ncbi:MAG: hypothetical protein ACLFPX_07660 [Candidatus Omnitrophota bacterium]
MYYVILGPDSPQKSSRMQSLKDAFLVSAEAREFDHDVFYAAKLAVDDLKRSLEALPAVAGKRLVLVHEPEKFKKPHKELLKRYLQSPGKTVVILESAVLSAGDRFLASLPPAEDVIDLSSKSRQKNVFDMTRMISSRRGSDALTLLHQLLERGEAPVRMLGALAWFWGQERTKVSEAVFKKGLLYLQEADRNVKRSRLTPVQSLELVITQLSAL